MNREITTKDLNILRQGSQELYLKVELCNKNLKILDSIEGSIISDSYSQDSSAPQRRTYNCEMVILNSSFQINKSKKIWIDKRLRIYYGVRSLITKEILWYLLGTFAYVNASYSYQENSSTLSISCADLMSEYDGTLNGQVGGYGSSNSDSEHATQGLKIPAGEDIRKSIVATLKDAGITAYIVEDIGKEIPYDLEFDTGVTYAEVWQEICSLYDSWEFFFDTDGTFVWRKIPTCLEDKIVLDDSIMKEIVISENTDQSFSGICNVTEVWGRVLELDNDDRFAQSSTYSNNTYNIQFTEYTSWDDIDNLTQIAVTICSDNPNAPNLSINSFSPIPIYDGDGIPLKAGALKSNTTYVFRYRRKTVDENGIKSAFYLLGQFQCYGIYKENSDECPFSIKNLGYEIKKSINYDNLSDDAACYNQAEYLTYSSTAMMDTITLTTLVIPWLEVNTKVEYIPQRKFNNKKEQYIVKNLSWSTGEGTMKLTLYKFLESFSYVYKKKNKGGITW